LLKFQIGVGLITFGITIFAFPYIEILFDVSDMFSPIVSEHLDRYAAAFLTIGSGIYLALSSCGK
jgi:hypothetical protein